MAVHADICTDVVLAVGHDLAFFSVLTSIPYAVALFTSLWWGHKVHYCYRL